MKKVLLLIAAMGLLMGVISCSDDDEPRRGNGVFTVNTAMVNHMYNIHSDKVLGMASTYNKLTLDTVKHTAQLELHYNDGNGDKTLKLDNLAATPKRLGFYVLSSTSDNTFSGYVDFNEGSMRYRYTNADGIRVISMTPEVFFLKTQSTITYDDTTETSTSEGVIYQFDILPTNNTATVTVSNIVHVQHNKTFKSIVAHNVPFTVTPSGFTITGNNINTTATYIGHYDGSSPGDKITDQYPFKTFNATIELANDHLDANYMIGSSATVTASGKTYPDYSAY